MHCLDLEILGWDKMALLKIQNGVQLLVCLGPRRESHSQTLHADICNICKHARAGEEYECERQLNIFYLEYIMTGWLYSFQDVSCW
jgi:hypothetical protein